MSKNKGNKGRSGSRSESGSESSSSGAEAPKTPRKPIGTVAERISDKVSRAHALLADASKLAVVRGAPVEFVTGLHSVQIDADGLRGKAAELVSSGWQPAEKPDISELQEGDPIAINPEQKALYDYIPGVSDGTAKLVAGSIVKTEKGRVGKIMLKSESSEGTASQFYGWVPPSHLVRR